MVDPSARDYDRMIGLAAALFEEPEPGDAWHLIGRELLGSLFRADVFTRVKVDYDRFDGEMLDIAPGVAAHQVPPGTRVHRTIITEHPLSVHYGLTGSMTPLRVSDLVPGRSWRRTAATAIARRLNISVRTVGKHQERLYRKLGAADRLSAVLQAQRLGVLRPPG